MEEIKKVKGGFEVKSIKDSTRVYSVYLADKEDAIRLANVVISNNPYAQGGFRVGSKFVSSKNKTKISLVPTSVNNAYFFLPVDGWNNFDALYNSIVEAIETAKGKEARPKRLIGKMITDYGELYNNESLYETIKEYEEDEIGSENPTNYKKLKGELIAECSKLLAAEQSKLAERVEDHISSL